MAPLPALCTFCSQLMKVLLTRERERKSERESEREKRRERERERERRRERAWRNKGGVTVAVRCVCFPLTGVSSSMR